MFFFLNQSINQSINQSASIIQYIWSQQHLRHICFLNTDTIFALLMTYSYAQKHWLQELQQMLQELSDESRRMDLKMNIAMTKVMVVDNTPINVNNVLIENVEGYVSWDNATASRKRTRTKKYNEDSWQAGRHTPNTGISSILSNLAICMKRQVYNSCVIWCRDLDTDQTSTEQTYGRTDQNGKKYAQHAIHIMLCLGWVLLTSLYCFTGLYIFNPMFAISSRLCLLRYLLCTIFQSSSLPVCLIVLDWTYCPNLALLLVERLR